jgi:hypothetical protein
MIDLAKYKLYLYRRALWFLFVWVLGNAYLQFAPEPSPVDVWFAGMNSASQGHLSGAQIRQQIWMLWTVTPLFYVLFEFLFWVANVDKTNWNLDKYPKNAIHVLLNHKALVLASILLIYSATFFIYGVLLGVFTFPLVVVALWKF